MKVSLSATKSFAYAGKRLSPGQQFYARGEQDARLLVAIGSAIHAYPVYVQETKVARILQAPEVPVFLAPAEVEVAAAEAEESEEAKPAEEWPKKRRAYRRRDMTAEE